MPELVLDRTITPSPLNPLGVKGVGEGGACVAPPAIVIAVVDALSPFGIRHVDMPLTAEKIWRAMLSQCREEPWPCLEKSTLARAGALRYSLRMSPSEYQDLVAFLGERFTTIDRRFEAIDRRFETIDRRFDDLRAEMFGRFDDLRTEMFGRFDDLRAEILGHFDELYRRLERLEQEYVAITQALRRIEAALLDEHARRDRLEQDLASLRENLAVLRARIDDVERRLPAS